MPEALWKAYIDFEIEQAKAIINGEADEDEEGEAPGEPGDRVRELYNRLLDRTKHVKVWVSFASFEASAPGGGGMEDARSIFRKAYDALKEEESGMKDEVSTPSVACGRTRCDITHHPPPTTHHPPTSNVPPTARAVVGGVARPREGPAAR